MAAITCVVFPLVIPVIVSLLITLITNALYWHIKRIPFQEQLKINGGPQLFCYDIDNENDLCHIIVQAHKCKTFLGSIQQTKSGDESMRSTRIHFKSIKMSDLDFAGKSYRYFYFHNTSNIMVQVAEIFDKEDFLISLSDWGNQLIAPKGSVGIFMLSYDAPKSVLVNYSGYEAEFYIINKCGGVPLKLRAKKKKSRKRVVQRGTNGVVS